MTIKKGTSTIATTGSTTWGGLEGTLSDQTDLQNALDAKASTLSPAFSGVPTAPTAQEGTNTTQIATTAYVKAAVDNIDALPDQTDMSGKYLATDGVNAFWKSPAGLPLLSHIWSDHLLNDASFLRADTFSWQNGTVYSDAYNHLVADYNSGTTQSETIGSYTISYKLASDGHKITTDETKVNNIYNESGVAWYYILDTTNQRFKLPRTKFGFTGYRDAVGKYVAPGLPNITGTFATPYLRNTPASSYFSGAFQQGTEVGENVNAGAGKNWKSTFNASRSSSIYRNGSTVQPPSTQMYLYFYVGNFVRNETEIDVGEITEALDGKLDQDLSNASSEFSKIVSGFGMPSNVYEDLTLGTSGSTYTAPANGYYALRALMPTQQAINMSCSNGLNPWIFNSDSIARTNGIFLPVKKGEVMTLGYGGTLSNPVFRFIYCEGEV